MSDTISILIVDDDPDVCDLVATVLRRERIAATSAGTAAQMRDRLGETEFDLVVLDVHLPDGDGFEILRDLRADEIDIPIIMLTAEDSAIDRILGLEYGADDYLGKPFEPRELAARIRSVLRRARKAPAATGDDAGEVLAFGEWELDLTRRALARTGGDIVELTSGEFELLRALVESPNTPLTRDRLLEVTKSREWSPFDRSIDVLIGRIRKKVESNPHRPSLIKTVRGVGYVLAASVNKRVGAAAQAA